MNYGRPFRLLIVLVAGAIAGTFFYKLNFDSHSSLIYSVPKSSDAAKPKPSDVVVSDRSGSPPRPAIPSGNHQVIDMHQEKKLPPIVGAVATAVQNLRAEKSADTKTVSSPTKPITTTSTKSALRTTIKSVLASAVMTPAPKSDDDNLPVPRICHYAWYSSSKLIFRFHHFISLLSAYIHIKPKKIMFWYEIEPQGPWWMEIRKRVPIIQMMYRKAPTEIFGNRIRVSEHQTDVVRLEAVMNYGGIYHDLDVIVLKSFDPLRKYNTTMGYETPGGLCNGIIVSAPQAPFLKIWHDTYKTFNDGQWAYHSVQLPAKLAHDHKDLIHTEQDTMHRPNWIEKDWLYKDGKIWNWSKNYAVHLWYRFHNVEHNPEDIKTLNTTMGQLFRYIYYGSKDLIKK